MPKRREKNPDEHFRGIIREQAKEIRQLLKRIKELEKFQFPQDEEFISDNEDTHVDLPKTIVCEDCMKGHYQEFELMGKVYGTCTVCEHRKRLK